MIAREEQVKPTLLQLCIGEELGGAFRAILAGGKPEELMMSLEMIPAMNMDECAELLGGARAHTAGSIPSRLQAR